MVLNEVQSGLNCAQSVIGLLPSPPAVFTGMDPWRASRIAFFSVGSQVSSSLGSHLTSKPEASESKIKGHSFQPDDLLCRNCASRTAKATSDQLGILIKVRTELSTLLLVQLHLFVLATRVCCEASCFQVNSKNASLS